MQPSPAETDDDLEAVPPHRFIFAAPNPTGIDVWRMHWPAAALADSGWDVLYIGVGSTLTDVDLIPSDVVRVHATNNVTGQLSGLVDYLHHHARVHRVVLDFDDDYLAMGDIQDVSGWWWRDIRSDIAAACVKADALTVATPPLAESYERFGTPVHVVRNYMPERLLVSGVPWRQRARKLGWMGMVGKAGPSRDVDPHGNVFDAPGATNPHGADIAGSADIVKGLDVWVVGEPDGVAALWPDARVTGTGRASPERPPASRTGRYPPNLYERMSCCRVAITPLAEHRFNAGKSWIKAVEYAWAGVPVVVPAWHPAYAELASAGVPIRVYRDDTEAREAIDLILDLDREQWERLSADVQRTATFAAGMYHGGDQVWRNALWRVVS